MSGKHALAKPARWPRLADPLPVFLRILEYYSGILFLTTNRVGAIDDAFRSRLHLTLYYPKLTEKQTVKIWKNNLDRLKTINKDREERKLLPIDFDKRKILKWVELNWEVLQWNGRQIRNAFQTAVALAEFKAKHDAAAAAAAAAEKKKKSSKSGKSVKKSPPPVMDVSHFKLIADASMQFNDYLLATHGEDEDAMAVRDKTRTLAFASKVSLKDVKENNSSSDSSSSESSESEASSESEPEAETEPESEVESETEAAGPAAAEESSGESSEESESEAERKKKKAKKEGKKKAETKAKSSKEEKKEKEGEKAKEKEKEREKEKKKKKSKTK